MEKESLALEKDNRIKIMKILGRLRIKADSSKYKKENLEILVDSRKV